MHPLRYVVLLAVLYVVAAAPSPRRRKRPKDEDEVNKATIGDLNRQIEELRAELAEAKSHPDPELSEQPTESPVTRPPKNKRKKNKRRRGPSRSTTVSPIHESDDVLSEDNEPNIHGMRQHPPSHHSHNNNPNTPTATQNRNSGQEFINIGGQFYEDLGAIDDQPEEKKFSSKKGSKTPEPVFNFSPSGGNPNKNPTKSSVDPPLAHRSTQSKLTPQNQPKADIPVPVSESDLPNIGKNPLSQTPAPQNHPVTNPEQKVPIKPESVHNEPPHSSVNKPSAPHSHEEPAREPEKQVPPMSQTVHSQDHSHNTPIDKKDSSPHNEPAIPEENTTPINVSSQHQPHLQHATQPPPIDRSIIPSQSQPHNQQPQQEHEQPQINPQTRPNEPSSPQNLQTVVQENHPIIPITILPQDQPLATKNDAKINEPHNVLPNQPPASPHTSPLGQPITQLANQPHDQAKTEPHDTPQNHPDSSPNPLPELNEKQPAPSQKPPAFIEDKTVPSSKQPENETPVTPPSHHQLHPSHHSKTDHVPEDGVVPREPLSPPLSLEKEIGRSALPSKQNKPEGEDDEDDDEEYDEDDDEDYENEKAATTTKKPDIPKSFSPKKDTVPQPAKKISPDHSLKVAPLRPGAKNAPRKATISKGRPHPSETIRPLTLDNNEEETNVNAEGPEETPDALTLEEPSPVTELTFIAPSKMMPKKGTHKSFSKTKGGPNKTKSVPRPIVFPEQYEPDNEVTAETLLIKSQSNDNTVRSKWENPGGFPVPDGAEP